MLDRATHNQDSLDADGPEIDLRGILTALWRRRWIVAGVAFGVFVTGLLLTMRAERIYKATATVLIDQSAPEVLGTVREVYDLGTNGYWASREYYETQYNVIRSKPVAQRVVVMLGLSSHTLANQLEELGEASAGAMAANEPLEGLPADLRDRLELLHLHNLPTRADMITALEQLDAAQIIQGLVQVEPVKESRLVGISIESPNPNRAALIANAVADAYIDYNLEQKVTATRSAGGWLADQLRELKVRLQDSELALYEFKRANNLVSVSMEAQQSMVSQTLSQLNQRLSSAQADRIALESRRKRLKAARDQNLPLEGVEEVLQNRLVQELKNKYASLRYEEAELTQRYTADHPTVVAVRAKLQAITQDISAEIDKILFGLENQYQAAVDTELQLRAAIDTVKTEALDINKKEIDYNRLLRERDNNQALYDMVLKRQKETELTQVLRVNNISKLELATPPLLPIRPRVHLNLALALVLGAFLGVASALGIDYFDNTIKSQEQVEQRLGLPFLGIIPVIKDPDLSDMSISQRDQYLVGHPRSSIAECTRTIRTNLLFMGHDRPLRSILVTSSSPQDGKSTTAINLAIAMAQAGARTALIDTDMRRPRLHKSFALSSDVGISNLILGQVSAERAIHPSGVPNLDIIPCGPIPPNPAELLHTESFRGVLESLRTTYDRILFDSPPVAAVADALVLATMVDGAVLVAHAGHTSLPAMKSAAQRIVDVGGRVFGVVLNDVDLENKGSGGYYYYYYYRAGYGEEHEAKPTA